MKLQNKIIIRISLLTLLIISNIGYAQINRFFANRENYFRYEADNVILNKCYDNQIKPFSWNDTSLNISFNNEKALYNKQFNQLFVEAEPLINFRMERDVSDNKYYSYNNIGALLGSKYKKLTFACKLDYSFNKPDSIIQSFVDKYYSLPKYRKLNSSNNYSALDFRFRLNLNVYKPLDIEIGNADNFIGEGYYSLLLSDNAPAYPYFKINANLSKIKYQFMVAKFNHIEELSKNNIVSLNNEHKYGAFHIFSVNVFKRLNLSVFETVIWRAEDSIRKRGFEYRYLNPLIFFRPLEYSIGSPDNILIGFTANLLISKNIKLYSQLMLDEFAISHIRAKDGWWANKQALQAGIKCYNVMDIKHLMILAEVNFVRPYTYSHLDPTQSYGHYNQSLAHPEHSNFVQGLFMIDFNNKKFRINNKNILMIKGNNPLIINNGTTTEINEGADMFMPYTSRNKEFDNYVGQGIKSNTLQNTLNFGYYLFDKNYLIELGLNNCLYKTGEDKIRNKLFLSLGIRSYIY